MVQRKAVIAANRFGLGARPGELPTIDQDPAGWLHAQLVRHDAPAPTGLATSSEVLRELTGKLKDVRAARQSGDADAAQTAQRATREATRNHYFEQASARYDLAATTDAPFRERLVHFWTNHFAVSADKQVIPALAGTLENEAIRPHVTGRFADLLLAVEQHPAMLMYLDNQTSMGPRSRAAERAARRGRALGLNENLAREILELHTLGVTGGYTQQDVTTFAKVLTGWSIGGGRGPLASGPAGQFMFRPALHEPGAKTLLGKRYVEDGMDEGVAVLRDLAAHASTAHFLAAKIARHFAADEPPPQLVERLAEAYRRSDGDLTAVYRALLGSSEPWAAAEPKFKTPHEFVISTYRALGQRPDRPQQMIAFLDALGQRPYTPGSPAGWPDTAAQWDAGAALLKRIDWAAAVGRLVGDRVDPSSLATEVLGPVLSDHTRTAIARAASAAQGLTLLLVSPEFQRR